MQNHIKMGEGGRVVIPAYFRKALDLHNGDELIMKMENGELRIFRQINALEKIRSLVQKKRKSRRNTDAFLTFRRQDTE